MSLTAYRKKRRFKKTPEPKGKIKKIGKKTIFVIQRHDASHLHYDFRLQIGKNLKSWAVPKGMPKTTNVKRLAVHTEDHPMEYANFEGKIPEGEYGAGTVKIWDKGSFRNIKKDKSGKDIPISKCLKNGQIAVFLEGKKLKGAYALVQFKDKNWFLIKMKKRNYE
jgi:bifunctional non-homologous end joining protein LigD